MATLVVEQDIQVVAVEASAVAATEDLEKGLQQTQKAVVSAKSSRKMRWWCFGIFITILVSLIPEKASITMLISCHTGRCCYHRCIRGCPAYD